MGATHSASKKVEVIVADDGTLFYALFEGMFESNVFPKTPRVSCVGFGTIDDVMRRIIRYASGCEGGMLKGAGSAYIKPESYIRQWRKALANPHRLNADWPIILPLGSGWRDIKPEAQPKVREIMAKYGFADQEKFLLSDPLACELVRDLVNEASISPWKLLTQSNGQVEPGLGYVITKKSKLAPIAVEIYKCRDVRYPGSPDHDYMCRFVEKVGPLVNIGWAYSAMEKFIQNVVLDAEKASPGCAEALIGMFRTQMEAAPFMPDEPQAPVAIVVQHQMDLLEAD